MTPQLQRTRRFPGPLLLTLGSLVLTGTVIRGHDPGLSSLDVKVSGGLVSASLVIAASEVAPGGETGDVRLKLGQFAADAIRLAADSEVIPSLSRDVAIDGGEARVRLSFALATARSHGRARRLAIDSDVPKRIGRGHRQLLIVSVDDRVMAETLLDSNSRPIVLALEDSFSVAQVLWVMMMAMAGGTCLIKLWRNAPPPTDPL